MRKKTVKQIQGFCRQVLKIESETKSITSISSQNILPVKNDAVINSISPLQPPKTV